MKKPDEKPDCQYGDDLFGTLPKRTMSSYQAPLIRRVLQIGNQTAGPRRYASTGYFQGAGCDHGSSFA
jgi:hypothetical protein